jgi:hypothetical protein
MKLLACLLPFALQALATPIGNDDPPKQLPNLLQIAAMAPPIKVAKIETLPESVLFRRPGTKRVKVWVGPLTLPAFNVCRIRIFNESNATDFMFRPLDRQYLELWIPMAVH